MNRWRRTFVYVSLLSIVVISSLSPPIRCLNPLLGCVSHGSRHRPAVALTFDDGPNGAFTESILEILNREKVRATFFLVGERALRQPTIVKKIAREGHEIGNHSFFHDSFLRQSIASQINELQTTERILTDLASISSPLLFRAPYGTTGWLKSIPFAVSGPTNILYDVAIGSDSARRDPKGEAQRAVNSTQNGSIILIHDGSGLHAEAVAVVSYIIPLLRNRGFELSTVSQLLSQRSSL